MLVQFVCFLRLLTGSLYAAFITVAFWSDAQADQFPAASWELSKELKLEHQKEPRTYRLFAPKGSPAKPKRPFPVVILLHGHGGSAGQIIGAKKQKAPHSVWKAIAARESLILIIPNGLMAKDRKQGWNDARGIPQNPKSDDVGFLERLIEVVGRSHPLDQKKIYATGISNGGHLALRLAVEKSEKYAAVAAVAAANPDPIFKSHPKRPISVLIMNGTSDRFMPYGGGEMIRKRGKVQSTDDTITYWAQHNRCGPEFESTVFPNLSRRDQCTAIGKTFSNAKTKAEVSLIRIQDGGHNEPSILQPYSRLFLAVTGRQNQDIEMAEEVWKFFSDKTLIGR